MHRLARWVSARVLAMAAAVAIAGIAAAQGAKSKGDPARGEQNAALCLGCHGAGGNALLAGMPSLAGQPATFLELQMILFREGIRDVPAMNAVMKGLKDSEILDLAAYFAGLPVAKSAAAANGALSTRGAALSKKMNCGSCHRADYSGQNQIPRLAGQREDYLLDALKAFASDQRVGIDTSMNGVLYGLTGDDLGALAHYFAHR